MRITTLALALVLAAALAFALVLCLSLFVVVCLSWLVPAKQALDDDGVVGAQLLLLRRSNVLVVG